MLKFLKILLVLLFLPFLISSTSFAQGRERRSVRVVKVAAGEIINKDLFIKAGEIVEISGTVNGDVYVAGGQVLVDGIVNGDLLAAAGVIDVSGEVTQDARIIGGEINLSGKVGRNATLVGGDIKVRESASLGGALMTAGGDILVSASVPGELRVYSGNFTLDAKVLGNAEAYVGTMRLTSKAEVKDLIYTSNQEAMIDKEASVGGRFLRKLPTGGVGFEHLRQNFLKNLYRLRLQATILSFMSSFFVGLALIRFFPKTLVSISQILDKSIWPAFGVGFLVLFLAPFMIFVLLVTIVGFPIGVILLFSYLTFLYLAKIYFSFWLGSKISQKSLYSSFILGLLVYYLITLVPLFGGIVVFVVLILGLGGAVIATRDYYQRLSKANLTSKIP